MLQKTTSQDTLDLIIQGNIVFSDSILVDGRIGIKAGTIVNIFTKDAPCLPTKEFINASGKYVFPGVVDAHVHCYSHPLEGFGYATRAAAAGGVTTIIEMPYDATGAITTVDMFKKKQELLAREAVIDVALLATIKKTGGLDQIPLLAEAGACGFKVSLVETDPVRFPRIADGELYEAFRLIAQTGRVVGIHAENDELINWEMARFADSDGTDARWHCDSRLRVAETSAVVKALELAFWSGVHLHIYHVSVPRVFKLLQQYRREGTKETAETCPHYLILCEEDMPRLRGKGKINPPLRSVGEMSELWELCRINEVDIVTSDHAPWPLAKKSNANIFANASGAPGVETLFSLLYSEGVAKGRLKVNDLAKLTAERPAKIFGLHRKGQIALGYDADLIIFDSEKKWIINEAKLHSSAGWSPYDGWAMKGKIVQTLVRGNVVYNGEDIIGKPGEGLFVRPRQVGAK